jgi:hypothetical protein
MKSASSAPGVALVILTIAFAACTTEEPRMQTRTPTAERARLGCPLGVAGATVTAEDTPEGITLSFRSSDKPTEMRARANDAAAQHGQGNHLGLGHDGHHSNGADHGLQMMQMPPAHSAADDIEGGARIRFVAVESVDTETLRTKLHARASAMTSQSCAVAAHPGPTMVW